MRAPLEVGICVNDLPRMLAFYTEGLGCEVKARSVVAPAITEPLGQGPDGFEVVWLQTPWGERIKLIRPPGALEAHSEPPHLSTHTGIAYLTFYVSGIGDTLSRLVALGARVLTTPSPLELGRTSIVFFRDPEGNALELVERADLAAYRPDLAEPATAP